MYLSDGFNKGLWHGDSSKNYAEEVGSKEVAQRNRTIADTFGMCSNIEKKLRNQPSNNLTSSKLNPLEFYPKWYFASKLARQKYLKLL